MSNIDESVKSTQSADDGIRVTAYPGEDGGAIFAGSFAYEGQLSSFSFQVQKDQLDAYVMGDIAARASITAILSEATLRAVVEREIKRINERYSKSLLTVFAPLSLHVISAARSLAQKAET